MNKWKKRRIKLYFLREREREREIEILRVKCDNLCFYVEERKMIKVNKWFSDC